MPFTESPFSDDQRAAVVAAYLDRGIRPAARVVALAAAGELEALPAFAPSENNVRDWSRRENKRRAGRVKTSAANKPTGEVVDDLRARLAALATSEVDALEMAAKKRKPVDLVRLQRAIRCVRDLAALAPGPNAPPAPGKGPKAERVGGETRTGLAAAILSDHEGTPGEMTATTTPSTTPAGHAPAESEGSATTPDNEGQERQEGDAPGKWADAEIAGLPVGREALAG